MLKCQELNSESIGSAFIEEIGIGAYMTRADLRHPIASRWAVRDSARSEAMLPGSWTNISNKPQTSTWSRLPGRRHPGTRERTPERSKNGYRVDRLCNRSALRALQCKGHAQSRRLSFCSACVWVVYSQASGGGGVVPVVISMKFYRLQVSSVSPAMQNELTLSIAH